MTGRMLRSKHHLAGLIFLALFLNRGFDELMLIGTGFDRRQGRSTKCQGPPNHDEPLLPKCVGRWFQTKTEVFVINLAH